MNYVQPDYRIPVTDPKVTVQSEPPRNPLGLTSPVPITPYTQPDTHARALQLGQLAGTTLGRSARTNADGTVTNL